jgi:GntR family transcriptional regulator
MPSDPAPEPAGTARRRRTAPAPQAAASTRSDRIARILAAEILEGRREIGSELPTVAEIAATQQCGTAAVQAALRNLVDLGLITRSRGGNARVVAADIRASYAVSARIGGSAGAYLTRTRLTIERQRQVKGDSELALLLGTAEGGSWLRISGRRLVADAALGPLSCFDLWLATRAATLDPPEEITPATLEALLGVSILEVEEEVAASVLSPAQARHLRARGGGACLILLRRFRGRGGRVVAALRDIHPADRAGVRMHFRRS